MLVGGSRPTCHCCAVALLLVEPPRQHAACMLFWLLHVMSCAAMLSCTGWAGDESVALFACARTRTHRLLVLMVFEL